MARIRTIKPQHWNDKELSKLSLQAHLLWIGLWNFSDDEGVFENDHLLIRSQIFPRRTDVRMEQISQWIDQLVTARFIIPFTHNGIGYYIHRTFKTHQKIDRPQPSKIPQEIIRRVFDEHSTNVRPCIVEDSISKVVEAPPKIDEDPFYDPTTLVPSMHQVFKSQNPKGFFDVREDYPVLLELSKKIYKWLGLSGELVSQENAGKILTAWENLLAHVKADGHLSKYSLSQVNKHFSSIVQSYNQSGKVPTTVVPQVKKIDPNKTFDRLKEIYGPDSEV